MHTHTHTSIHSHAHIYMHTHTYTRAHTDLHTNKHTHLHTNTHTHMHSCSRPAKHCSLVQHCTSSRTDYFSSALVLIELTLLVANKPGLKEALRSVSSLKCNFYSAVRAVWTVLGFLAGSNTSAGSITTTNRNVQGGRRQDGGEQKGRNARMTPRRFCSTESSLLLRGFFWLVTKC